jgi:plasmid replication initiation protein
MRGGVLTIHEDYFLLTGGIERWLFRVARKHAGQQDLGWSFTMRQLHAKSGSSSRVSDFAIDIRKVVEADSLPEYALTIHKNEEGEEVIQIISRDQLAIDDKRYETPRHPRRRLARGMTSKAYRVNESAD